MPYTSYDTLPAVTSDLSVAKSHLQTFGYCLLADALDRPTLTAVAQRLTDQARAEWQHSIDPENPAHVDDANQWVNMLLNKGEIFQGLVLNEKTDELVAHLLGPTYLLSACDAQVKHRDANAMPLHSDQWWMPRPVLAGAAFEKAGGIERNHGAQIEVFPANGAINPPVVCVVMWMISDFTEDNGATRVVPGSHLVGKEPDPSVPHKVNTVTATGRAGTALVFDGRTWHGAGANQTTDTRYAITCGYCAPQFRPLENYPRAMRAEVLERASSALLKRIGFKSWGIYGHAGDPSLDCIVDGNEALGILHPEPETRRDPK